MQLKIFYGLKKKKIVYKIKCNVQPQLTSQITKSTEQVGQIDKSTLNMWCPIPFSQVPATRQKAIQEKQKCSM